MATEAAEESPAAPPDATSKRIARYDEYFDLRTFSRTSRKTHKPVPKRRGKKSAIVVRRQIDSKGRHVSTEIDIKSPALAEVLRNIHRGNPGNTLNQNQPVASPELLFHSRQGLQERLATEQRNPVPDEALISDLETGLQYILEDHAQTLLDLEQMTSQQEITYDLLWALIAPNTLVYHFHQYTEQPQILLAKELIYRHSSEGDFAQVVCDIISNDGKSFGFAHVSLKIQIFTGARMIQDLSVFPLSLHKNAEEMRELALVRGKRFVNMEGYSYHEITGAAVKEDDQGRLCTITSYGRVMIDPASFRRYEPNCEFNWSVVKRLDKTTLDDQHYIICTPVVFGFCFGFKDWGGFALDRLQDIEWSDEPFNLLVIGEKEKMLISALVGQHVTQPESSRFDDIVQGKGRGLIGLLSGGPGCGKTLTAEAIAEKTHRALYVVSAGELGIHPRDVERRLTLILQLAQTWNAVLLLDEADVFLQKRDCIDLARNALVSIFLRKVEYYQGVLILTTNLLQQIDPAFDSRIHFSIHYPDLNFSARRQLWKTFCDKVLGKADDISAEEFDRLAGHELNGRQIKNMVSCAQAIALDSHTSLKAEHVDAVLEVANQRHFALVNQTAIPAPKTEDLLSL